MLTLHPEYNLVVTTAQDRWSLEELASTTPQLSLVVCGGDSRAEGNDGHPVASEKERNDSSLEGGHLIWKVFEKHDGDKDSDNM
jgi:hypothetical protein